MLASKVQRIKKRKVHSLLSRNEVTIKKELFESLVKKKNTFTE